MTQDSLIKLNQISSEMKYEEFIEKFPGMLYELASAVNDKDYGLYDTIEVLTNQTRFDRDDAQLTRPIFRKVIELGALKNAGTTSAAHGITFSTDLEFVRIYGVANDANNSYIPLPNDGIYVDIDSTNVNVTTSDDKTAYTFCTVTIEYIT